MTTVGATPSESRDSSYPVMGHPVMGAILYALAVAATVSVVLGSAESLMASLLTIKKGHVVPTHWILACCGRAIVTHWMLWIPVFCVVGLAIGLIRRRSTSHPAPLISAIVVGVIGCVAIPADLSLANWDSGVELAGGYAFAVILSVVAWLVLRWGGQRLSGSVFRRLFVGGAVTAILISTVPVVYFIKSPLFDPSTCRLPAPTPAMASTRPNLLWIVLDTVRPDHMSCYGYERETTPFLNRWVQGAHRFDRAFSNGIWTVPGHAAMFTGKATREHGMDHGNYRLRDEHITIAEVLAAHGYDTASFSANAWISPAHNLTKGFDVAHVIYELRHPSRFSLEYWWKRLGLVPIVPWLDPDFGAALANRLVADWAEERSSSSAPFFVFVNYLEGHLPYRVPKAFRAEYLDPERVKRSYALRHIAFGDLVEVMGRKFNIMGEGAVEASDRAILKEQYDGCVRYLDDRVEDLLGYFERCGLLENTVVVIVSDHGEYLGGHGMWSHRFLTYNDVAHVALMIKTPGQSEGTQVGSPVQLSDLHGTVLTYCLGEKAATGGRDAVDLLELAGKPEAQRYVITEFVGPALQTQRLIDQQSDPEVTHRSRPQIAIQDADFKYMVSTDGRRELYDLRSDPGELRNLLESMPEAAEPLVAYLENWLETMPAFKRSDVDDGTSGISEEALKSLRSLGYLGGQHED